MNQLARNRNLQAARRAVLVCAALVAVLLSALPARADQTVSWPVPWTGMLYKGPGLCVHGYSELIRHDTAQQPNWNAGMYLNAQLATFSTCTGQNYTWNQLPTGWGAIKRQLLFWNGNAWAVCKDLDPNWYYTKSPAASTFLNDCCGEGLRPCGSGYYGLWGSFFAWDGSAWQGGWVWSGYLYSQ